MTNTINYHTIGSKYAETKDMDIAEIAKLVRKEIKEFYSEMKGVKISVRIERYSMGQSMAIRISNTGFARRTTMNDQMRDELKKIVDQYNYDDIDSMTDYYNVRFHGDVRIED